jgi:tetratricopeptide (TPR) repeat protein
MSVESSIIPISQNVIFEHRTYLSSFGFFLAFTSAFFYFIKERYLNIAVIIILMIASINTVLTYQRNKIWKNEYTLWADCVKKSPNKARANNNLCSALVYKGRKEEAINYCNKAIRINPDYATAYSNRALAYDNLGQYQRAIEDYNEAIHRKPDFSLAYFNRGFLYNKLKQYEHAIEDYSKAISLYPDFAYAYNNRGAVYFKLDNYQRAIEDYDKAINLQPDFTAAYNNRCSAYLKQGKESLACIDAQKACAKGDCLSLEWAKGKGFCRPENSEIAMDWINKEQALWNGEKYADPTKAIEYLNNAIKLQQNNAASYSKRGTVYYNLGQYQRAIEDYSEAIRLKPDYSLAYYNRGCIYVKNPDQYEQAIKDFNKAIKLKPDYTEAYNNLSGIYLIQGKKSLGCSNAQKACELGKCKLLEVAKGQGYCR